MKTKIALAGALLMAWSMVGAAHATPMTYASVTTQDAKTVKLTYKQSGQTVTIKNVVAGEIILGGVTENGVAAPDIDAWCVDVFDTLTGQGSYTPTAASSTAGPFASNPTLLAEATALVEHGEAAIMSGTQFASAATQIALWSLLYGGDPTDLKVSTTLSHSILSTANTFLANVINKTWTASANEQLVLLSATGTNNYGAAGRNQDLVYLEKVSVPEPASFAALGVGLFGLTLLRRRNA